ncbi:MAG: hypothetical protein ACLPUT_12040 [Solirubrobacteraceae bacterium]
MGPSSVRAATVIAAVLMALPAATAHAQASSGDASATRAYLQADLAETHAEVKGLPAAFAAIEALRGRLQAECPGVLADEPKPAAGAKSSASAIEISEELLAAVFGAAERTEYLHRRRFARTVSRLSWGDRALTRRVHSYAAAEVAEAQVPQPDLCADIRAWVSSGYQTVSADTSAYVQRMAKLSRETEGAEEAILHKLKSYESGADKHIARQITKLNQHGLQAVAPEILAALAKIAEVLHGASAVPS